MRRRIRLAERVGLALCLAIAFATSVSAQALDITTSATQHYAPGQITIQLTATGGAGGPYVFSKTPGIPAIPAMRVLNRPEPLPTFFPGTVTAGFLGVLTPGVYSTSIRVTDSANATFDKVITITVTDFSITSQFAPPRPTVGAPYDFELGTFGVIGTASWPVSTVPLPAGLSVNASGHIVGTATTATGTSGANATITLADSGRPAGLDQRFIGFNFVVNPYEITTNPKLADATVNVFYTQTIQAPGCGAPCTFTSTNGTPAGLSLSSAGVLSGTPTNGTSGQAINVSVTGTNGTSVKTFSIRINFSGIQTLRIDSGPVFTTTLGGQTSSALQAAGGTQPYIWEIEDGTLPPGISMQGPGETVSSTALPGYQVLAGRAMVPGTYLFTLKVTDANGLVSKKPVVWNVPLVAVSFTGLPISGTTLVYNQPYTQRLLGLGGTLPYTWVALTPMPGGLTLDAATGVVSGTVAFTGNQTVNFELRDSSSPQNVIAQTLNITAAGTTATTLSFTLAANQFVTKGTSFSQSLGISGGTGPYTVEALTPLPPGFALLSGSTSTSQDGALLLAGTAIQSGVFSTTIRATDSLGNIGVRTFVFTVSTMTIITNQLRPGYVGVPYDERLLVLGGTAPVTVSLAPGNALPNGLTVNAAGRIRGTPTEESSYNINFVVTDATGASTSLRSLTLVITNLAFTGPEVLPTAVAGQAYNYAFTATGGANPITFSTSFLPGGLTLASNGTISGTVASWEGFFQVFVNATDGLRVVSRRFSIFVVPQTQGVPSLFVSPWSFGTDLVVGQPTTLILGTPDRGKGPFTWSVGPGSTLPAGLSLVAGNKLPANGVYNPGQTLLAGAPTTAGTFTFDLVATDANGIAMARTFNLHVSAIGMLSVNGTKNPRIGEAFSFQLTTVGGTAPYTYTIDPSFVGLQPALPPGVTLSSDGLYSGTPTSTGSYTAHVTVTDQTLQTYSRNITLNVFDFVNGGTGGLEVTTGNMADGAVGIATSQFFGVTRSSGSPPALVNWTVVSGALPPGMDFVVCCGGTYLYGPPSAPGTYTYKVRGTNAANPAEFAEREFTFNVVPMQIVSPPVNYFQMELPIATAGVAYSTTIKLAGGTRPYTFTTIPLVPLPKGLTLSANGVLSGTPQQTGEFVIAFKVTDAASPTPAVYRVAQLSLTVLPAGITPPLILSDEAEGVDYLLPGAVGVEYGAGGLTLLDFEVRGGVRPFTWSVHPGSALPPGLALVNGTGAGPSVLAGKPTTAIAGDYEFSLDATDAVGQTVTVVLRMSVFEIGVSPARIPNGVTGTPYSVTLTPFGGTPPYTLSTQVGLFEGSGLPPGLTLSAAGVLSGTPTAPGNFVVPVIVTDSAAGETFAIYRVTIDNPQGHAKAVGLSPSIFEITQAQGAPGAPVPINITLTNGTAAFTAGISGIPGASLSATSGVASGAAATTLQMDLNLAGLTAGTYHGVVWVNVPGAANLIEIAPITITVGPPPTVNAISVTPDSGAGITQSFTFNYSDSAGVTADLNAAQVRFTNIATGTTCVVYYRATTGLIRMQDDAGVFGAFVPLGSGTLANSRCMVNLAASSATPSGNDLSLTLNMTFLGAFSGPATVAMRAGSVAGPNTGWVNRGTFTGGAVLGAISITPDSGTGITQTFVASFSDSLGVAADLKSAQVRIGTGNVGSCVIQYNAMTNQIRILDDAGVAMAWVELNGLGTTEANSQCTLDIANSDAVRAGTDLTLTLRLSFDPSFLGLKTVALRANSNFGTTTTGFVTRGSWTVGAAVNPVAVLPASGSSAAGATQGFTLTYSDTVGADTDLKGAKVRFGGTNGFRCVIDYNATTLAVRMQNDSGVWSSLVPLGIAITGWSTMCDLDTGSSATPSGNDLSLTLRIIFKAPFAGAKHVDMRADSLIMGNGAWQNNKGTWTVTP